MEGIGAGVEVGGAWLPLLALVAGVLSFTSPCAVPLVPGYLSYMSGVSASRGRTLVAAILFVAGFAAVFTMLGAAASAAGALLEGNRLLLERLAGIGVVLLGVFVLGRLPVPFLMREGRPLLERVPPGPGGALLLGLAFALGWTPCIGPVLASILVLAGSQQTLASGAVLLLIYSLGLGIPFLLAAAFIDHFRGVSAWLRAHAAAVNGLGGVLLIGMGVLIFSGRLQSFMAPALEVYSRLNWPPI